MSIIEIGLNAFTVFSLFLNEICEFLIKHWRLGGSQCVGKRPQGVVLSIFRDEVVETMTKP